MFLRRTSRAWTPSRLQATSVRQRAANDFVMQLGVALTFAGGIRRFSQCAVLRVSSLPRASAACRDMNPGLGGTKSVSVPGLGLRDFLVLALVLRLGSGAGGPNSIPDLAANMEKPAPCRAVSRGSKLGGSAAVHRFTFLRGSGPGCYRFRLLEMLVPCGGPGTRTDSRRSGAADAVSEVRCGFHSRGGLAATVRSNRSRAGPETGPAADVLSSPCCEKLRQKLGKDPRVQMSVRFLVLASSCGFFHCQSGGQELGITSC